MFFRRLKVLLSNRLAIGLGMRARLAILGLLALIPIVILEVHNANTLERQTLADAHTQARIMVGRADGQYDDVILQTRMILDFLAAAPEIRSNDQDACNALMKRTADRYPWLTGAFVKDIKGDTICKTHPAYPNINWADRPYFQKALQTKAFTLSNFFIGPSSHKPVVAALEPVLDENGNVTLVVGAAIDLTVFNTLLSSHETSIASVTIFDGAGTVIARYPDSDKFLGDDVSQTPLFQAVKQQGTGEIETQGLKGDMRIFAFQPFADVDSYIAVGLPKDPIIQAAHRRLLRNLGFVTLILGAATLLLARMLKALIVRPAEYLSSAAEAMGEGDYDAVPEVRSSMPEIGHLLSSFRRMALRLRERETELKASEQAATALNRNLMLGEQIANAGYWRVDFPSQKLTWSAGVYRIFGQNSRTFDLNLATWVACIHPDDRQKVAESIELAFALQRDFEYTVRTMPINDRIHYIQSRGFCEIGSDGRVSAIFGAILDITPLKESEAGLLAARQAAENANRAKSDFLSSMSHELRTPLTSIIGFADLMLLRNPSDSNSRYLNLQRESGQHLLSLINDILDHSKIEAGKLDLEIIPFDLKALVESCRGALSFEANRKGLDLDATLGVTVPRHVMGDPGRLKQIILNLMGNAIKFTQTGSVSLEVTLQGIAGEVAALGFRIRDTGIGIAPDKAKRLFKRYAQAEASTTRQFGGTGLGLSISKGLVEAMGGTIGIESIPGTGSTFWFNIRLLAVDPVAATNVPAAVLPKKHPRRILLADDSPVNQLLFVELLTALGHEVHAVGDGEQALEAFKAQPFDLILMDVQMPVMDGLVATQTLRTLYRAKLPIIGLTASAMPEDVQRCLAAGMDSHLAKPIDIDTLAATIDRVMEKADS